MLKIILNTIRLFIAMILTIFVMCLVITAVFSLIFWETRLFVNLWESIKTPEMYNIRFLGVFLVASLIISIIRNR